MADPAEKLPPPAPFSPERGKVAIRDPDGSIWKIPNEDLGKAQAEGAQLATEAEWKGHDDSAVEAAGAGLVGAARGVTALSPVSFDTAMVEGARALGDDATSDDVRDRLRLAKEAHPTASAVGEGVGMVAPAILSGGSSAAVQGQGVVARAGARALQAAPRALAEGVGYGLNAQSAEDSLGNHKFAAENYLTAGFKGGAVSVLLGGALHAGLGAGAEAVGKGRQLFGRGEAVAAAHEAAERDAMALGAPEGAAATAIPVDRARVVGNLDAGVSPYEGETTSPFRFGKKTHSVGLDTAGLDQAYAGVPAGETPLRVGVGENLRVSADPDEGIIGSFAHGREEVPNIFQPGAIRRGEEDAPVFFRQRGSGIDAAEHPTFEVAPRREGFIDQEQSAFANREQAGSPLDISRKKDGARTLHLLDEGGTSPLEASAPFRFGRDPEAVRAETRAAREAAKADELIEASQPKSLIDLARGKGDEQAFLATGARAGDVKRLGTTPDAIRSEMQRLGGVWKREIGGIGPLESRASIGQKIAAREQEVAESLKPLYRKLDEAAARPSMADIVQRYQSEVRAPAARGLFGTEELGLADHALENLAAKGEHPSFSYLHDLRMDLDKRLYSHFQRISGGPPVPPGEQALRGLRNIVAEELDLAAERASTELGTNTAGELRLRNQLYRDLRIGKKTVMAEAAHNPTASNFSMSDGQAAGISAMGLMSGHPVAALASVANVARKNYGNQLASFALDKSTRFLAVQDAANKIDEMLSRGTKAFIEGTSTRGTRAAKTLTAAQVREVRDAVSNQALVTNNVRAALGDLPKYAPNVSSAFSTAASRTAAFLAQNLPKETPPMSPFFQGNTQRPMSDTELARASVMIETADDPTIVLDRIRQGRLTREHVRTLRITAPETYAKIRTYLTDHAADLRPQLTEQQGVALSILFQTPITASMKPENITAFQASFVGGSQAPKGGDAGAAMGPTVAQMAAGPIKGGGTRATFFDQFEKPGGPK